MCFLVIITEQPGNTKITENNVSISVDKDVLGLNTSMHDIVGMDTMLDSKKLPCWIKRDQLLT